MGRGPVVAASGGVAYGRAVAVAGGGEKHDPRFLHGGPLVERVGVGEESVVVTWGEGAGGGEGERVGEDDDAVVGGVGVEDGGLGVAVGTGGRVAEEILPLGGGESTPKEGLVAAVGDGVIDAPVAEGEGTVEVGGVDAARDVERVVVDGIVGVEGTGTGTPSAGGPTEEVYKAGVVGGDVGVVRSDGFVLRGGEEEGTRLVGSVGGEVGSRDGILEVALGEEDLEGVADREETGERSGDGGGGEVEEKGEEFGLGLVAEDFLAAYDRVAERGEGGVLHKVADDEGAWVGAFEIRRRGEGDVVAAGGSGVDYLLRDYGLAVGDAQEIGAGPGHLKREAVAPGREDCSVAGEQAAVDVVEVGSDVFWGRIGERAGDVAGGRIGEESGEEDGLGTESGYGGGGREEESGVGGVEGGVPALREVGDVDAVEREVVGCGEGDGEGLGARACIY